MAKTNFEVNNLTNFKIDKKFLTNIAEKTLLSVKLKIPELSIVLACDARMRSLNKKYKNKDRVTDVLAFDYGEIVICLPQAKRQAKEIGNSLEKELGILLIHGILHLAGQKDSAKKDFNKMNKKQEEIWQKITL